MTDHAINVLVVDDSAVARMQLAHLLEADPQIHVSAVNDGQAALDFLAEHTPDVILMDVTMPGIDGFETTRQIMEARPTPVVICSSATNPRDVATTFRVMEAGAVACVAKPAGREHADHEQLAAELRQTVRLMSEVRVVRRWARMRTAPAVSPTPPTPPRLPTGEAKHAAGEIRFIGIGASTGGPPVLQMILGGLPKDLPVPILIVQHIAVGFLPGLAEWLRQTTGFPVHLGAHGVRPLPGNAYLAPDGFHMGLSASGHIHLAGEAPEGGLRPAVSYLFRSLADVCGPDAVGVLLTGMGVDGAAELKLMRDRGAITIAQDRQSSIVHGMPGQAIALGGATHVLPVEKVAGALLALVTRRNGRSVRPS